MHADMEIETESREDFLSGGNCGHARRQGLQVRQERRRGQLRPLMVLNQENMLLEQENMLLKQENMLLLQQIRLLQRRYQQWLQQEGKQLRKKIGDLERALGKSTWKDRLVRRARESRFDRTSCVELEVHHGVLESALVSKLLDGALESVHVSEVLYPVVVSAVSLLLLVYQYLNGHVDKGGTLTCSTGSFQFRATYISIVLFEGAYVWIKFRDVPASTAGGYRRRVKDKLSGTIKLSKPEARYTPPGQSGNSLYLGVCTTDEEARIKKQIAAFYYGRGEGTLDLGHGHHFQIPSVQMEQEWSPSVKEKRKWVRDKVREVYESYDKQKAILNHPSEIDAGDYCTFLEKFLLESPSDMMFDSQAQQHHVQDVQVQASAMVVPTSDEQGVNPVHAQPLETAYSLSSHDFLEVDPNSIGNHWDVDVGALTFEHCAPQKSLNCGFPMVRSVFTAQPGIDQLAALPDVVTPPLTNVCETDSAPNVLAMKVISLLEQKIQDQEQKIFELQLENERLRALT